MAIDKRKIAKNSLALYMRMLISVCITFYTSRVILQTLGIDDFGTYNVVGGVAVMFSFLSGALSSSTTRYITYAIGRNDRRYTNEVFSIAIKAHFAMACAIVIISECVGLWLIYNKLSIEPASLSAANWVFQCSMVSTFFAIINLPYTALVIAEERMSFFAYTNIGESAAKLAVALLLVLFAQRLIAYAIMLLVISLLHLIINRWYCVRTLPEVHFDIKARNPKLFRELAMFSWWNTIKNCAIIGNSQANSIFVNIWGGPAASAAMGIYNQINSALIKFFQSFQSAFTPQITKNWAQNDRNSFNKLISTSTKYSSVLIFLPSIPLSIYMDRILALWLVEVPQDTAIFCQTGLACLWIDSILGPLGSGNIAIGNIRNYQIVTSLIWLSSIPISWAALHYGMPFKYILAIKFIILIMTLTYNLRYLSSKSGLNLPSFVRTNIITPLLILAVSYSLAYLTSAYCTYSMFAGIVATAAVSTLSVTTLLFAIGMSPIERNTALTFIRNKFRHSTK